MLIEVTDAAGIDVPRFCYHKKLSVAANCRMCLVEVEKAPKPLPACATPVMPDMVVKTQSPVALAAQKGTMEFLLINHPLDCPICDQGGECELQDVAMGYGGGVSQYTEGKRVVMDKYIGPLIATEMTRCIHCTRCVRFGEEIAGIRELGATGRGENVRIGTFIEKSVSSEVSGNVIDVCPVGALTARPSRYSARSWELTQAPSVSRHDSVGSNLFVHLDGDRVNRVVPRENELINETWISDRDRYSYQGLRSDDRATTPMVRINGELKETSWEAALQSAADALKAAATQNNNETSGLGVLASASATLEELYLAQKLGRALGSNNIDHRLGQTDFQTDAAAPVMPWLGMQLNDLESLDAALFVGTNIRKDQPIAALRLRKSALKGGEIHFINPRHFELHFDAATEQVCRIDHLVAELAAVASAAGVDTAFIRSEHSIEPTDAHRKIAASLQNGERTAVVLGNLAVAHPAFGQLQVLAQLLAEKTGATAGRMPERANTAGAWLAGMVPHRSAGGGAVSGNAGQHAAAMLNNALGTYLMLDVEASCDAANPGQSVATLKQADHVISLCAFISDETRETATVVLPIATFTETFGTYVNATGQWQSSKGLVSAPGEARPAWKVLRVLGDMLALAGFDYMTPEAITTECQQACGNVTLNNMTLSASDSTAGATVNGSQNGELVRSGETPIYATDSLVRRSVPLQKTEDGRAQAVAMLCHADAERLGFADGDEALVAQSWQGGEGEARLAVKLSDAIPSGSVWIPTGIRETAALGALGTPVSMTSVASVS